MGGRLYFFKWESPPEDLPCKSGHGGDGNHAGKGAEYVVATGWVGNLIKIKPGPHGEVNEIRWMFYFEGNHDRGAQTTPIPHYSIKITVLKISRAASLIALYVILKSNETLRECRGSVVPTMF
jgi:hypothetical protein